MEGHDNRSQEKFIVAPRPFMGGSATIESFRPQYKVSSHAIKAIREVFLPSWAYFHVWSRKRSRNTAKNQDIQGDKQRDRQNKLPKLKWGENVIKNW